MIENEWRHTDHGLNMALTLAYESVRDLAAHVEEAGRPGSRQIGAARDVVHKASRVLQYAEMGKRYLTTTEARRQLGKATKDFHASAPGVVNARDIHEHGDEYSQGRGNLQRKEKKRRDPAGTEEGLDEVLAREYRPDVEYVDGDPMRLRLHVGRETLDVDQVAQAAARLVHELYAAARTDEGEPVSRQAVDQCNSA